MLTTEICSRSNLPQIFELLRKNDKTLENYETLVIRDSLLVFGSIE